MRRRFTSLTKKLPTARFCSHIPRFVQTAALRLIYCRFALMLAHAGAAVIVPERSLLWPPTGRSTNREGAVVICAEHWLVGHTKVFNNGEQTVNDKNIVVREGYAYVGPRVCDLAVPSDCVFTSPFIAEDCALKHYCRHFVWVPVGETEGGDSTRSILSDRGLRSARWLQPHLGLAPIKALVAAPSPCLLQNHVCAHRALNSNLANIYASRLAPEAIPTANTFRDAAIFERKGNH
jgi:hypothetical protein